LSATLAVPRKLADGFARETPMKRKFAVAVLAAATTVAALTFPVVADETTPPAAEPAEKKAKLAETEECSATEEIYGKWDAKADISLFLTGYAGGEIKSIEFTKDEEATKRVLAGLEEMISSGKYEKGDGMGEEVAEAAKAIYASGRVSAPLTDGEVIEGDFAFATMNGGQVLFLLTKTPKGNTNWESNRIAFVPDPKGDHDLLFVGGDRKAESYVCFKRESVKDK
jgi:hypothetical protein